MKTFELSEADFEDGAALARSVGWLDSPDDWRTLSSCAKCIGLREPGGALVATAALCDFGEVVSVAKMLVRADFQRRGLGARMLSEALSLRRRVDALQMLIATAEGRPLYERAGFEAAEIIHFISGVPRAVPSTAEELRADELDAAIALDARSAGCRREAMISARWKRAVSRFGLRRGGELIAFGLRLPQGAGSIVGPLLGPDEASAREVLHALLPGDGMRVRVDVAARQRKFRDHVLSLGLVEGVERMEMSLGGRPLPGERELRFCPAALAYG